jgi:peptidoglycan-associated lipoprotein
MNALQILTKNTESLGRFAAILLLLILTKVVGITQPVEASSYESMIKTAEEAAEKYDYNNAIDWFDKAYKESKDPNLLVAMGDLSMLLRDYSKAERLYDRVLKRDKLDNFLDIKYDYAKALKYQGKYKDALSVLNEYITMTDNDGLRNNAKILMRGILNMDKYPENIEAGIALGGEGINSPSGEATPAWYSDGTLYYASMNTKSSVVIDGSETEYTYKIYTANRLPNGGYDTGKPLEESINRVNFHTGGVSFSSDGSKMYLVRYKPLANGLESAELMVSKRSGESWAPPQPIESLNDGKSRIRHPFEGELFGEKVLYFASDRDGGMGGYDIYYATIKGNEYGSVTNLGEVVNTQGDELTPFYKDGTLYFSSDMHPGLGGLDNFYTSWNGSKWEEPINMGFNYNTSYDDHTLRFNNSGNAALLVSNRPHKEKKKFKALETCCDDIYFINIRELVIDLAVLVNNDKGPLDGATLELFEKGKPVSIDSKTNFASNNFSFLLDADKSYKALVTREGYYPDSVEFNTNGIFDDYTVKKTFTLKSRPIEDEFDSYSINEPIRLNNIYYDLDKANILPDAEKDLNYLRELMEQYPDMVIELSSHTDSQGETPYNQKLSQRRADSAKAYLVSEGIEARRIKGVGYGERMILNHCKNGVKCTDDEHRFNRRTEFKIIAGPQTILVKKSKLGQQ